MTPPRFWEWLLEWTLPAGLRGESTVGDLAEGFARRAEHSPVRAHLWYAKHALSLAGHHIASGEMRDSPLSTRGIVRDLRWSTRVVRRHPAFAAAVVAVLGVGLGANAAVFTVVDGTLRDSARWAEPDRTLSIWPDNRFSFGQLDLYAQEQDAYEAVGGFVESAFALVTPDGESRSVNGLSITPALFREFALQPRLGRAFADDDAMVGSEPVAIVSERLWRTRLGSDPELIGSRIEVAGQPFTLIGVQPSPPIGSGGHDVWIPHYLDPRDDDFWKKQDLRLVGVLRDGATIDDAHASLTAFTRRLTQLFPQFFPDGYGDGSARVEPAEAVRKRIVSTPLLLLLGGTFALVVVTALNAGSLLLGRAIGRRRELAVRAAIGASRGQIVRQLAMEGLVLAFAALVVGLSAAAWGAGWIARLFVEQGAVQSSSILSPNVLLFTGAMALATGLVLGGVPIMHFLRSQRGRLQVNPNSGTTAQRALVALQAAVATTLLVTASMLVATVAHLRDVPLGFDAEDIVVVELSPPSVRVAEPVSARTLYDRLVRRAEAVSGVEAVGLTGWLPMREEAPPAPLNLEEAPVDPAQAHKVPLHRVDPGFFRALGVSPLQGRLLGPEDQAREPSVVVVNQALADLLWPNGVTVGTGLAIDPHAWEVFLPVVGVVPNIRSARAVGDIGPAAYIALAEQPAPTLTLVARTRSDSDRLLPDLVAAVGQADPLVPVRRASSMEGVIRAAYSLPWVMMGLLSLLAGLATALGTVGIYAVLAHYVAIREKEIGIRMALGARPQRIVAGVLYSGLALAALGVLGGGVVAAAVSRSLGSLLYEVRPTEPFAYLVAAAALLGAATIAAAVPAWRAARLSPAEVLGGQ